MKEEIHRPKEKTRGDTKAKILMELMKGPCSRVRLKERMSARISSKDVDFHIQRGGKSLLKQGIVREYNNLLSLKIESPEDLFAFSEVIAAEKDKGEFVRDSINSAYVKCFLSSFGDGFNLFRNAGRDDEPFVHTARVSDGILEADVIDRILKLSTRVRGEMSLELRIFYILMAMGNVRMAKECYLESTLKDYNFPLRTAKPQCEIWNFTLSLTRTEDISMGAFLLSSVFPELLDAFYHEILKDPVEKGVSSFSLVDRETNDDGGIFYAINYLQMLMHQFGTDFYEDVTFNPFKSRYIPNQVLQSKDAIKRSKSIEELNRTITLVHSIEYIKLRKGRLEGYLQKV